MDKKEKKKFTIYKKRWSKTIKQVVYWYLLSDYNFNLKIQTEDWKTKRIKDYLDCDEEKV